MKPIRIQLSRKKGWKLPENTVVVSRPSKWGNPYRIVSPARYCNPNLKEVTDCVSRSEAVSLFIDDLRQPKYAPEPLPSLEEIKAQLKGRNLACWCPLDAPCHADVLLEIANEGGSEA